MLTIQQERDEKKLTVTLIGRLDSNAAPQLETALRKAYKQLDELIFDCRELTYISSGGLRVLLSARKQMDRKGQMRLINVTDAVRRAIEIKGLDDVFRIPGQSEED